MPPHAPATEGELAEIRRWFRYIAAARLTYLDSFSRIPSGTLTEDRGASFPSILDIFAHALNAFQGWIVYDYADKGEEDPHLKATGWSLAETREFTLEVNQIVEDFLASLRPEDLDREFTFHWRPNDESTRASMKTRDMLWHLVEEELQHRGEINALLWQKDIDAPVMDWIDWVKNPVSPR